VTVAFAVIPAIDVRDGRAVRLRQGDFAQQTTYGDSPIAIARRYEAAGARWLHLVDLDAAREGRYTLDALLSAIRTTTALSIQTGGGVRSASDIDRLLRLGASRVVVGTAAVREPDMAMCWLHAYGPERLTLALDVREDDAGQWCLPVAGWTSASNASLDGLLQRFADAGLRHVLCTDIRRDGMLEGFNLSLYARLAERWPQLQFQASGGVRDARDIVAARAAGASAAILGRALLDGRLALAEALSC
jgi:phosphoribosylformimino-5-aminoimidazole carboxamide ribotide isomerase